MHLLNLLHSDSTLILFTHFITQNLDSARAFVFVLLYISLKQRDLYNCDTVLRL